MGCVFRAEPPMHASPQRHDPGRAKLASCKPLAAASRPRPRKFGGLLRRARARARDRNGNEESEGGPPRRLARAPQPPPKPAPRAAAHPLTWAGRPGQVHHKRITTKSNRERVAHPSTSASSPARDSSASWRHAREWTSRPGRRRGRCRHLALPPGSFPATWRHLVRRGRQFFGRGS